MSRNSSGSFTLPAGNPVVSSNIISSTAHNATMADLRTEVTDSLCRSGKGEMLAPLQLSVGTVALPGLTFVGDPDTGFYRVGANNPAMSAAGTKIQSWTALTSTIHGALSTEIGHVATQSTANTAAIIATGNGSAPALAATGGTTGAGVTGTGGATSGVGGAFTASAGNSAGLTGAGNGTGSGVEGTAGAGTGAYGVKGVAGVGSSSHGVFGSAGGTLSVGVFGEATAANNTAAVYGNSGHADAHGVFARTTSGTAAGIAAGYFDSTASGGYALIASGDATTPQRAAFRVVPQDTQPAVGQVGDIYVTTAGLLKICTVAGTPGTWVSVGAQ